MRALAILIALGASSASAAATEPTYSDADRAAIIAGALEAFAAAGPDGAIELDEAIGAEVRDRCRSAPTTPCLIDAAAAACAAREAAARPRCLRLADVLVTNRAAETERVSAAERYRLMGSADGYRAAMRRTLRRQYARLAAELAVAPERTGDLAASIDRFCARRARQPATMPALAWQRCVAALVYYVGTEPGGR